MTRQSTVRLLVTPDASAAEVMNAIVARTGLAVSERGVVARPVQVAYCAFRDQAHPLSIVCTDTGAAPDLTAGSR